MASVYSDRTSGNRFSGVESFGDRVPAKADESLGVEYMPCPSCVSGTLEGAAGEPGCSEGVALAEVIVSCRIDGVVKSGHMDEGNLATFSCYAESVCSIVLEACNS